MGTVGHLAEEIERGLLRVHPGLHKTVTRKLAATVAAVLQAQTANTAAWAAVLPIETERDDMRLQWIARLLANPLLDGVRVMEPFARQRLNEAAANGQTVVLSMDQTDLGERFAILVVSVRVGERALPLAWAVEAGAANLGFAAQRTLFVGKRRGEKGPGSNNPRICHNKATNRAIEKPRPSFWLAGCGDWFCSVSAMHIARVWAGEQTRSRSDC